MRRLFACLLTLVVVVSALALATAEPAAHRDLKIDVAEKNPWTHLGLKNQPENFQFVIVTDRTGGHRPGVFEAAVDKINLLQPEFVMSVGDLIEGNRQDMQRVREQWDEFNPFVEKLEMPFFYVPGNHDLLSDAMIPLWQNQFGRTYYHFVYHDVLFLCLNSEDPPDYTVEKVKTGRLGPEQLAWAERVLAENADVRWTIVFLHKPMWQYGDLSNWNELEQLLAGRKRTAFAGHHHKYRVDQVGDATYYALATTGGSSKLGGPSEGQFDHIVWVTMTPDGPRLSNLMLDGIWSDDPVAEARGRQAP